MRARIIVKPLSRLRIKQLYLIGWWMSSRGAVELVIALLALRHGLITEEIFSALVVMAIITTLVFPFVLQREIRKDPQSHGVKNTCILLAFRGLEFLDEATCPKSLY